MLLGRKRDVIIRGGQNIYPFEIEGILMQHPRVKDVAIVRMPDPVMAEKQYAYFLFYLRITIVKDTPVLSTSVVLALVFLFSSILAMRTSENFSDVSRAIT